MSGLKFENFHPCFLHITALIVLMFFFVYIQSDRELQRLRKYHTQQYVNGTKCDIGGGKQRKTEVRVGVTASIILMYGCITPNSVLMAPNVI